MDGQIARAAQWLGWVVVVGGLLALVGYGAYELAIDETTAGVVKVALGAVGAGLVLLFVIVLRQRLIEQKTDEYKDVRV